VTERMKQSISASASPRTDKQRLDWWEKQKGWVSWRNKSWRWVGHLELVPLKVDKSWPTFETAREAIDWAMEHDK
jgi:hypothetical protein